MKRNIYYFGRSRSRTLGVRFTCHASTKSQFKVLLALTEKKDSLHRICSFWFLCSCKLCVNCRCASGAPTSSRATTRTRRPPRRPSSTGGFTQATSAGGTRMAPCRLSTERRTSSSSRKEVSTCRLVASWYCVGASCLPACGIV